MAICTPNLNTLLLSQRLPSLQTEPSMRHHKSGKTWPRANLHMAETTAALIADCMT
jgi:hypothetical protein